MAANKSKSTPAKAPGKKKAVEISVELQMMPEGSFPYLYEEIGTMDGGKIRVGIHAAKQCFYFFVGGRIVQVSTIPLLQTLTPHVVELVKP